MRVPRVTRERQQRGDKTLLEHRREDEHRGGAPLEPARSGEAHDGPPEEQRGREHRRVLQRVRGGAIDGSVVDPRHMPEPEVDGEERPDGRRMQQHARRRRHCRCVRDAADAEIPRPRQRPRVRDRRRAEHDQRRRNED